MNRLSGLDTLRAVAIAWVLLFHSYLIGGLGDGYGVLQWSGWMGVDLFFVLSGYLIGTQVFKALRATGTLDFTAFYKRRFIRILPAFFVVLALYEWWPAWPETKGMQPLWQFLTFTFNLQYDNDNNYAFSHVWSLCVEEHFYLVFPLLAFALTRRPALWKFALVAAIVVVGGMLFRAWLWSHLVGPDGGSVGGPADERGLRYLRYLYYPTWARLDGLVAGVALAACGVYRPAWLAWVHARVNLLLALGVALLAGAIVLFDAARADFWPCVVGYPLVALAMMAFVAAGSGRTWFSRLTIPGAGWLAAVSYSLYLSHKGVFMLVQAAMGDRLAGQGLLRFAIYVVATLAGGALLHYAVERPFLRWRDAQTKTAPEGAVSSS
ncbi:MAG TPA: acyltransferase [Luteibacter sp.]|uniref:acyltransferase family protein n=1 Tax=Luteibacter sp. TaxID=1886636 RepID=UPI002B998C21|nr:acyltransferase [Luteibacter sp.]HVI56914.1 acyltransferase [Luteibacter sp.]